MPSLPCSSARTRSFKWFDSIIFDMNGTVLRSALAEKPGSMCSTHLNAHEVCNSTTYYNYEKGLIDEHRCSQEISHIFNASEDKVQRLMQAAAVARYDPDMLALVQTLQQDHKVYGIANMPKPVSQSFGVKSELFNGLDQVLLSFQIGERMPHLGFFEHLLETLALNTERTLFVSSNLDSVVASRSLGFYGIVVTSLQETIYEVQAMCNDPIPYAQRYLRDNARRMDLETAQGKLIKDAFAQFLLLDATEDESIIEYDDTLTEFAWSYGNMPKMFVYPPDIDTNAIGMSAIKSISPETRNNMMDKMLHHRDSRGILQTYLTDDRTRVCATAALNGLTFFNEFGRGHQVKETEDFIFRTLKSRGFRDGTRYYPTPDFFLYYCSRLIIKAPHLRKRFQPVLRDCMLERTEAPGDALSLACRVIASARCGIRSRLDFARLLMLQEEDGSFGPGLAYRFARGGMEFYHRGLTAALAVLAIKEWDHLRVVEEQDWLES